jgi:hypothetical protein
MVVEDVDAMLLRKTLVGLCGHVMWWMYFSLEYWSTKRVAAV